MNKYQIITLAIVIITLISGASIAKSTKNTKINNDVKQVTTSKIDILDIKYENGELIATIHSEVSYRTVHIYFYQSRIIGNNPGHTIPIGVVHIRTDVGETRDISIPWIGLGKYLITVDIPNIDTYSEEIQIPKTRTISNNYFQTNAAFYLYKILLAKLL